MPTYRFEPFELDPDARVLRRNGDSIPMAGRTLDTLLLLVQNRGRLVDKDELLSRVWAGTVVEEANLSQSISTVRKILGDSPKDHRYIATIAGRGYQFVAPVTEVANPTPAAVGVGGTGKRTKGVIAVAILALSLACAIWFLLWRRPPKPVSDLTQRRITFNSGSKKIISAAISPDGKYVAFSDASGIHVRLLSTGEERRLPVPGEATPETSSYIDSWFPDGTQLLGHSRQRDDRESMWTASVMGQSSRELRRDARPWQVSPDGKQIAFSPAKPFSNAREIWLMDAEGENARKILALGDAEWLSSVYWSPDGRRLAYVRLQRRLDKYFQWIESCDLKGENRTPLLAVSERGPWLQDIAWLQDGRVIYSRLESPESYEANLWQIVVDARGAPTSGPKRMTNWAGSSLVGLTASADGTRIALRKDILRSQVWLGDLIPGGYLKGLPRRLTNDELSGFASDWTSDSKAVILESEFNGKPNVFKQSISAEEPEPLVVGLRAASMPRLSPDGAWVLYTETEEAFANGGLPTYRLMRAPVNGGGSPRLVLETQNRGIRDGAFNCSRAPASVCLVREPSTDQKRLMLLDFDPYTGKQKLLRSIDISPDIFSQGMMSPDGSTFAIATGSQIDTRIRLFSLSGGSDREITVKGWPNIVSLDWAADGKGFYCGSASPEGSTLIFVDLQGSVHVVWRDRETSLVGCFGIPSPDNRHLAIMGWVHNSNVWLLENF